MTATFTCDICEDVRPIDGAVPVTRDGAMLGASCRKCDRAAYLRALRNGLNEDEWTQIALMARQDGNPGAADGALAELARTSTN